MNHTTGRHKSKIHGRMRSKRHKRHRRHRRHHKRDLRNRNVNSCREIVPLGYHKHQIASIPMRVRKNKRRKSSSRRMRYRTRVWYNKYYVPRRNTGNYMVRNNNSGSLFAHLRNVNFAFSQVNRAINTLGYALRQLNTVCVNVRICVPQRGFPNGARMGQSQTKFRRSQACLDAPKTPNVLAPARAPDFRIGQKVMCRIASGVRIGKGFNLRKKYEGFCRFCLKGPFIVVNKLSNGVYKIKLNGSAYTRFANAKDLVACINPNVTKMISGGSINKKMPPF